MSFIPTQRILICYTSREWKWSWVQSIHVNLKKMAALSVDGMAWSWWKCNWQAVGVPWRTVRECLRKIQRKRIVKAKLKLIHEFSRKSPESGNHESTSSSNINQITHFSELDARHPHPLQPTNNYKSSLPSSPHWQKFHSCSIQHTNYTHTTQDLPAHKLLLRLRLEIISISSSLSSSSVVTSFIEVETSFWLISRPIFFLLGNSIEATWKFTSRSCSTVERRATWRLGKKGRKCFSSQHPICGSVIANFLSRLRSTIRKFFHLPCASEKCER